MWRRNNNLALLQQYGANAWRVHNYLLEADAKAAETLAEGLKEETTRVNRERKNTQVSGRPAEWSAHCSKRETTDADREPVDLARDTMAAGHRQQPPAHHGQRSDGGGDAQINNAGAGAVWDAVPQVDYNNVLYVVDAPVRTKIRSGVECSGCLSRP